MKKLFVMLAVFLGSWNLTCLASNDQPRYTYVGVESCPDCGQFGLNVRDNTDNTVHIFEFRSLTQDQEQNNFVTAAHDGGGYRLPITADQAAEIERARQVRDAMPPLPRAFIIGGASSPQAAIAILAAFLAARGGASRGHGKG